MNRKMASKRLFAIHCKKCKKRKGYRCVINYNHRHAMLPAQFWSVYPPNINSLTLIKTTVGPLLSQF